MKNFFIIILSIILFWLIMFWLQYASIINYSFFQPKIENAKREVFENTNSYVQWKKQEISKYRLEYNRAQSEEDKNAIRITILHASNSIDLADLWYDLESFVRSLQ